jgi:thiol-disulfide isomerase/thioredoxin
MRKIGSGLAGRFAAIAAIAAATPVAFAIYGIAPPIGNVFGVGRVHAADAPPLNPSGAVAAFVVKSAPEALPDVSFVDAKGEARTMRDFKGKVVLLNLWATWCAPCRKEMPSLDRLQTELGSDKFEVVAISVDRSGPEGARRFLDSIGIKQLALYAEPTARMGSALRAIGMPTTLLIDGEGREIGRLTGPAEWDSADAKALIQSAMR